MTYQNDLNVVLLVLSLLNAGGTITRMPHINQSFCTVSSVLQLQYGFNSIPTSDGQPYLVNLTTWLNIGSRLVAIRNSF